MVSLGDSILQATDTFARVKIDQQNAANAAKEAAIAQDLSLRAQEKLKDDFNNSQTGDFNADQELAWYDNEVSELTKNITDDTRRAKFKTLLQRSRGAFGAQASNLELRDQQKLEQEASDMRFSAFATNVNSEGSDPIAELITSLEINNHQIESGSRTRSAVYEAESKRDVELAIGVEINRLNRDFGLGNITREQYDARLQRIDDQVLKSGVLSKMSGTTINQISNTVAELKANSELAAQKIRITNLSNNVSGDIARVQSGLGSTPGLLESLQDEARRQPENLALQQQLETYEFAVTNADMYTNLRNGDTKIAEAKLTDLQKGLDKLSPAQYIKRQSDISKVQAAIQKANQARIDNSAEAYKNDPDIKTAWSDVLINPTPDNIANYTAQMIEKEKTNGGNINALELWNDQYVDSYVANLEGLTPDQAEQSLLQLKELWDYTVDEKGKLKASDLIVNQISRKDGVARLARYAGTPEFNTLFKIERLTKDSLKTVAPTGAQLKDLKAEVGAVVEPYLETLLGPNADDPNLIAAEQDRILKAAMAAPLFPGINVSTEWDSDDIRDAAKWAIDMNVNRHEELITNKRVKVSLPKRDPNTERVRKALKTSPNKIIDLMVKETMRRNNVDVELRGDVNKLIDTQSVPGVTLGSFDYDTIKDTGVLTRSQDGTEIMISVPTSELGSFPMRIKDGKDGSLLIKFTPEEVADLVEAEKSSGFNFFNSTGSQFGDLAAGRRDNTERQRNKEFINSIQSFSNARGTLQNKIDEFTDNPSDELFNEIINDARTIREETDHNLEELFREVDTNGTGLEDLLTELGIEPAGKEST